MDPKRLAILQLISEDSAYEDRFFRTKKNPVWFFELKRRGYFDPKNNPKIKPSDREGYYVIPQWNVLEYLERVAEQTGIPENEKYISELLEIIKNVSSYKDETCEIIDNYRTWWFFIKILLKLPNKSITPEILDLVPVWLSSKYGGSLVDADITTKLLPKFLYESAAEDEIKKAEQLINSITDFIWIKKKGIFRDQEEEAHGVVENHWLEDFFIEKQGAKLVGKLCDKSIFYKLADKLKTILNHEHSSRINVDYQGLTYRLSTKLGEDFEYLCQIGTYKKKAKNGEEDFIDDSSIDIENLFSFSVKAKNNSSFCKLITEKLDSLDLPSEVKDEFKSNLAGLFRAIFEDYSYIWFKNLVDLPGARKLHEFKHVLLYILAQSLYEFQNSNPSSTKEVITSLLSEDYQNFVFKRLVIAFIAKNWATYKDIFWNKILKDNEVPLLEDPTFEHEVRSLFSENVGSFTPEEKDTINGLIDKGPQKYVIEENKENYILYWKQRWYGTLKGDIFFAKKYESLRDKSKYNDENEEKEGESSWIGPGPSPITEEDILRISNVELAEKINSFKERDLWEKEKPSAEGFAKALNSAVKKQPTKFTQDLSPFLNVGFFYIDHLLEGFKEAWTNKITLDWEAIFTFILSYISRPDFWKNKLTVKAVFYDANYSWTIGAIGELIQVGTRDDDWSISPKTHSIVKNILKLISDHSLKEKEESRNFPTHVLNCGWGKINIGLLYFTLRLARQNKENNKPLWEEELKSILETFLERENFDAYTVLGENLISFAFLDKNWVEEKTKEINKSKDPIIWEAFMSGYLAAGRVNLDLYLLMKKNYEKALSFDFKESMLNERLIDHIGIGYLNGVETINGKGLLALLWKKWQKKQISALISYFHSQNNNLESEEDQVGFNQQMKVRIIQFWRDVYKKLKDKKSLSQTDKEILSEIVELADYIQEIDAESHQWLMLSAQYVGVDFNSPGLIESINKLKDKGERKVVAKRIAEIYLEMMKAFYPDYDQGHIREIVEFLYQSEDEEVKDLADTICDKYAKAQIEMLTDIYLKYNPK